MSAPQCEGWIHTPAFVLGGSIGWHQCRRSAVWRVTFKREKEPKQTLPACQGCYEKVLRGDDQDGAKVLKAERIQPDKKRQK
jgi:hypothetical protein